jgi:hypothetical protein
MAKPQEERFHSVRAPTKAVWAWCTQVRLVFAPAARPSFRVVIVSRTKILLYTRRRVKKECRRDIDVSLSKLWSFP